MARSSIQRKILVSVLTTALLGLLLSLGGLSYQSRQLLLTELLNSGQQQAQAEALQIRDRLNQAISSARTLASILQGSRNQASLNRDQINAAMKQMVEHNPDIVGAWTLWEPNAFDGHDSDFVGKAGHDQTGRFIPYWHRGSGQVQLEANRDYENPKTPGGDAYYQLTKATGKSQLIEPYLYSIAGQEQLITSVSVPIKNSQGQFIGVAGIDLTLAAIQQQLSPKQSETTLLLLSEHNHYLSHPDHQRLGQEAELSAELLQAATNQQYLSLDQQQLHQILVPIQPIEVAGHWSLVVQLPLNTLLQPTRALVWYALLFGVIALLAISLTLGVLLNQLTKPLSKLSAAMYSLSLGGGDLRVRLSVEQQDEIGLSSQYFNQFMQQMQKMIQEIRSQGQQLSHASQAMALQIEQVAQASSHQAEVSAGSAAAIEQITVSISQVSELASTSKHIAGEALEISTAGNALLADAATAIDKIATTVRSSTQNIQGLQQHSKQIGGIANVIREIADQTNLLALNAAIEAARAGEQGRGFAVVADEVRNLAARTAQATSEIQRMTDTIQKETLQAVKGMEEGSTQVEAGVKLIQQVVAPFEKLHAGSSLAVTNLSELAHAAKEQTTTSNQMAQNVEQIASMTETNSVAIEQIYEHAANVQHLCEQLNHAVSQFHT